MKINFRFSLNNCLTLKKNISSENNKCHNLKINVQSINSKLMSIFLNLFYKIKTDINIIKKIKRFFKIIL